MIRDSPEGARFPISVHASEIHEERRIPDRHLGDSTTEVSTPAEVGDAIAADMQSRFDACLVRLNGERSHDEYVPAELTDTELDDMAAKDCVHGAFAGADAFRAMLGWLRGGIWKEHQNGDGTHPSGSPTEPASSRWQFDSISGRTYEIRVPTIEHIEQGAAKPRVGVDI